MKRNAIRCCCRFNSHTENNLTVYALDHLVETYEILILIQRYLVGIMDLCLDYFQSPRIALAPASQCSANALQEAVGLFQSLGKLVSVLKDIPGMVLTRTVAMLSNEASLLVQEEVSDAAGVNLAMRKGVNYPQGPFEWAEQWGLFSVVETLDNLRKFYGERYQVSSWLQQKAKHN